MGNSVAASPKILIADRNRHVRDFLRRELNAEGYRIEVAKDGREVLNHIQGHEPPDLLILDLEMPYVDELEVLAHLEERQPRLPVVIHSIQPDAAHHPALSLAAAFLEKKGDLDLLKAVVAEVLGKNFSRGPETGLSKGGKKEKFTTY
jgi:CheY-like chemotaxis protein